MAPEDINQKLGKLSQQELDVLHLYCLGLPYKDIATKLFMRKAQVNVVVGHIYIKLGLDTLERIPRWKAIFTEYCPALENLRVRLESPESTKAAQIPQATPPESVEPEKIPEEIPPESVEPQPLPEEVERMVEEDERALVILNQPGALVPAIPPSKPPRRRRSCLETILVIAGLLICVLLATNIVLFFPRGEPTPPVQTVIVRETVVVTIPPTPVAVQSIASPIVPQVIVVTATPMPATSTPRPTAVPTLPSKTPTPEPNILFQDNFNNGLSPLWTAEYGNPIVVSDALTSDQKTLMAVGKADWTNYIVTFEVSNMLCQQAVFDNAVAIGVRYQNRNNMVALRYSPCGAYWYLVENGKERPIPNSNFTLPPLSNEGVRRPKVTVSGNRFEVDGGTSIVIDKYPKGKVAILVDPTVIIDNFTVYALP